MAGSRIDFSTRLSSSDRASRNAPRVLLSPATTTATTEPPPPAPIVAKAAPKPVVKKTAPTTAKPKSQAAPAPKPAPAASSSSSSGANANTPTTVSSRPMPSGGGSSNSEQGKASWYNAGYHESNPWICAHKTIPKGIVLTVTNLNNGAQITCEVGDRGPYVEGRILDLSKYAFSRLASPSAGVIPVKITW